jgi:hypothetical protein
MHGVTEFGAPLDCQTLFGSRLIERGDANLAQIVRAIVNSPVWRSKQNVAIVVTFDEDGHGGTEGCCGVDPSDAANRGGGHVATIVVTNHGPRGVRDATPYSHYSLLRTIEEAFGIHRYLGHAGDAGVVPMRALFAARAKG